MSDIASNKVGYKRPPKHSQFAPGKSGNPNGRPIQDRSLKRDLTEELSTVVVISSRGREMRITKQRALIKMLVEAAIGGNHQASMLLFSFYSRAFRRQLEEEDEHGALQARLSNFVENLARRHAAESNVANGAWKPQPEAQEKTSANGNGASKPKPEAPE